MGIWFGWRKSLGSDEAIVASKPTKLGCLFVWVEPSVGDGQTPIPNVRDRHPEPDPDSEPETNYGAEFPFPLLQYRRAPNTEDVIDASSGLEAVIALRIQP